MSRMRSLAAALVSVPLALSCASGGGAGTSAGAATAAPSAAGPWGLDPAAAAAALRPDERPRPYPPFEDAGVTAAVEGGTRTRTGRPGPRYWQQRANYRLAADYDPVSGRLQGTGSVWYFNRSPDRLPFLIVHLRADIFAPRSMRTRPIPDVGPVTVRRVAAAGQDLAEIRSRGVGWFVQGTLMRVGLPQPLAPGDSVELSFAWEYVVPDIGPPRGGRDTVVSMVSYWYPQVAVYDDVNGWHADDYRGNAEFYMGYGDYDVALTVPAGYLIGATGTLVNEGEVLTAPVRARLAAARTADTVVHVVGPGDRGAGVATATGPRVTWRFHAANVRDFAWGTSARYVWDVTRAAVGDATGDGRADTAMINSLWVPERHNTFWRLGAGYTRHAITHLSDFLWPYPYPQMTALDGPGSCGGMEYPMITCIGGGDSLGLAGVILHETAHMWFPMQVGSDEKRHSWQDEGLTQYNGNEAMGALFPGRDWNAGSRFGYLATAQNHGESAMMTWGDFYPQGYGIASYSKPATILGMLRGWLGEETFLRAYREYGRRWQYRHPTPWDLFNTFNDVAGRDLWWFWRAWFFETWTLDQAVGSITPGGDVTEIVIEDHGLIPMPALVVITKADGSVERDTVPVEVWLAGRRAATVRVRGEVTRVEIDPDQVFADVNRRNNRWTR